jgi:hypothetical protein
MKKIRCILAMGLLVLTACSFTSQPVTTPQLTIPPPQPTVTETKILPTPSSLHDSIIWDQLEVTMDELEVTGDYITDYGSSRVPTEGNKFLWVHVGLRNTGQIQMDVPASEHYSILYAATELKPGYGHRQGYTEYTTLGPLISPNQELDGWLRFDIPATAELKDLRFVFLPESAQVGASYGSPNYPYADDKPMYVWNCEP